MVAYVREILSHQAYKAGRYKRFKWTKVWKYDLKETLNKTHFVSIQFKPGGCITMMDQVGVEVSVSETWARHHVPRSTIEESRSFMGRKFLLVGSTPTYIGGSLGEDPPRSTAMVYQNRDGRLGHCMVNYTLTNLPANADI